MSRRRPVPQYLLAFYAMLRYVPAAMTALAVLTFILPGVCGSLLSPLNDVALQRRQLASVPSGYGEIGPALLGTANSDGSTNSSFVEFGAAVALSSGDGHRLAVGAPRHDWSALGSVNEDGGAIFIYDYNDTTLDWDLKSEFYGNENERMGDRLSMSSDGSILAIRRYNDGPDHVEVYSVDTDGEQVQLGLNITCPGSGQGVSLSPDGTRLAVSCEWADNTSGEVQIYDYVGNTWTQVGLLENDFTDGLFGYNTAFNSDGTRIAVSAPNYGGGASGRGFTRVYTFNAPNDWTMVGSQINGTESSEKFGNSMDMSSDGDTLAIGAPLRVGAAGNATHPAGAVSVYKFSSGEWSLDAVFEGEAANDKFGRAVAMTNTGNMMVASSTSHNGGRGQMRLFEKASGTWNQIGEFEGSTLGGRLGGGILGVDIIGDGSRLVAGSTRAATNGLVEVWNLGYTSQPSASPSTAPSAAPSISAAPSSFPSVSSAPSILPPTFPPVELEKHAWDIDRLDPVQVQFTEATDTSEIVLLYNISLREVELEVFEEDCSMEVPTSVASASGVVTPTSSTHGELEVSLDIKQDQLATSGIWMAGETGVSYISMCVRVDLLLNGTSVHFYEQKLLITIGMTQGFQVDDVELNRIGPYEEEGGAGLEYELLTCQCDASYSCLESVLTQGSDVFICVETLDPGVDIVDIDSLTFIQESYSVNSVVDGVPDFFTTVTLVSNKKAVIRSQMLSAFFEQENPADVSATGFALLGFADNAGRRLLRSKVSLTRALDQQMLDEAFDVTLQVESSMEVTSGAAGACFMTMLVFVMGVSFLFV